MQHIMTTSQRQQAMTQVNALVTNALTQFLEIGQLATLETDLLQMTQRLCQDLLPVVLTAWQPAYPAPTTPCSGGGEAHYQRQRAAQVMTRVGPVT